MFWDVLRCFEMFWETSCNQSKPQTKKPTQNKQKNLKVLPKTKTAYSGSGPVVSGKKIFQTKKWMI
jgi:hypothetical protein